MARSPQIRITQNDRKEYAKLVKNAKAKISRTKKKHGTMVNTIINQNGKQVVEQINIDQVVDLPSLESFQSRKQYNEWKEQVESFTNRNNQRFQFKSNDYGTVASKALINKITHDNKKAQKIAEELRAEANEKEFVSGGKVQGTVGQRMLQMGRPNTAGIHRPPDFNFSKVRDSRDLLRKAKNLEERSDPHFFDKRMQRMKENFIETLKFAFNSHADDLVDKLEHVPPDIFYEMYLKFDEFDFTYYPSPQSDFDGEWTDEGQSLTQLRQMESYVDEYLLGNLDLPLKGLFNDRGW